MKEILNEELDQLNLQLETLKDSTQSEALVISLRTAIEERIRYVDAQINLLVLKEEGAM